MNYIVFRQQAIIKAAAVLQELIRKKRNGFLESISRSCITAKNTQKLKGLSCITEKSNV